MSFLKITVTSCVLEEGNRDFCSELVIKIKRIFLFQAEYLQYYLQFQ
jgi:hypothetical protein